MTTVAVVGLGKLGFPIAAYYAQRGAHVVGIDISSEVVETVNQGRSPIGFEPGASEGVADLVTSGAFRATVDYRDGIQDADVIIVLVPLLAYGGNPDFANLDAAVDEIGKWVRPGTLVVFETTLPIGSTRRRFAASLRKKVPDLHVAFSPERVFSGRIWKDLETYPKLVAGVDDESTRAAAEFYEKHLTAPVWSLVSVETAEMVKLAETTYRDINIAFANELARFSTEWDIDVLEVIEGANSQPFSHIHRPGVGVGGHCIPHYPHLLQESSSGSDLIAAARTINESMPAWVVSQIARKLGSVNEETVLIRGVAYRGDVKETASSPAFGLRDALRDLGANVVAEDPYYQPAELIELGFTPWQAEVPRVVVVATDHVDYRGIDWSNLPPALVVDGRNALDADTVRAAGHTYLGIGR
jgi:nucleotide sugar dehydrogenase